MFGIINSTLRIASLSESTAKEASQRDARERRLIGEKPAILRFFSNAETKS